MSTAPDADLVAQIEVALDGCDLDWSQPRPGLFSVRLPGRNKLATDCALELGRHTLQVRAFVCRAPDENHAGVYRWVLQRNMKLSQVAYALDGLGDLYLVARIPLSQIDADAIDGLLGVVTSTADDSFNPLLELGFSGAIRKEWAWRLDRGESTANLAAFEHLRPQEAGEDAGGTHLGSTGRD